MEKKIINKIDEYALFDIIDLLSDLVVFESIKFNNFLTKLIELVSQLIPTDACLIYIFDKNRKKLVLIGSKDPKDKLLGKIILNKGEGITGWVAEQKRSVAIEKEAYKDKRFKYFKKLPEDKYEAFLSIPIINKDGVIGVMNLQNKSSKKFSKQEIKLVETVVRIIASGFQKIIMEEKVSGLEQRIQDNKIIAKAKGFLMEAQNISESQAYKKIQKSAMKQRKSMKEIAQAINIVFDQS